MKIENPKNYHAVALKMLYENKKNGVTSLEACKKRNFFKFTTRLSELRRNYPKLKIIAIKESFINALNGIDYCNRYFLKNTNKEFTKIYKIVNG